MHCIEQIHTEVGWPWPAAKHMGCYEECYLYPSQSQYTHTLQLPHPELLELKRNPGWKVPVSSSLPNYRIHLPSQIDQSLS